MDKPEKKTGLFGNVSNFFKRVGAQETIVLSSNEIQTHSQPAEPEEIERNREIQIFRQYLQAKNWNIKHTELYEEFRRMDSTFPIINAALRLYAQEVCLSGETVISTPSGSFTIEELFNKNKRLFYVKSFDKIHNRIEWNMVKYVKNNGKKPVYRVTVKRNVDSETMEWDTQHVASFKCTDNHKLYLPDGSFKELKDLKIGDELWSMYFYKDPSCKCLESVFNKTVIENIEFVGEEDVYDLVDVSPNHHFLIKLTDSFHLTVHNCTKDTDGNVLKIVSDNKRVKELLEDCFFKNLKLNSTSYLHTRSFLKFGNHWSFIETRRGVGVIDLIHLPPEAMRILLTQNSDRLDDFKYQWFGQGAGVQFEPWEVVHWKNVEDIETEPYGVSILRSIVDTYRRIILMREAMIVYRITRAPQRLLFKIDTTGLSADDALILAADLKKQMYKKPLVNKDTGEMDHRYNTSSIEENLYMTSYEGDTSDVRVLEGASNMDAVEDYKIIKDDLFAGLLIPKSYLTFEEDLCLRSSTKIITNEGIVTLKELSELFEDNPLRKIYSLSCNKHGIIVSGKILWCNETKLVNSIYRITINNNHTEDATDNHPFMLENLKYKRADALEIGDKLKGMYEEEYTVTDIEVVELMEPEYVMDLEVLDHHNFALASGIFVHNSNKAALAQEDLRFAGAIKQYQAHYIEGLLHIALVHLHINGCSKEELESFEIQMHSNSTLAEKTRNELLEQRMNLAKSAWDSDTPGLNMMSYTQVLKDILHFTDEEIKNTIEQQLIEKKLAWRLKQIDEQGYFEEPEQDKKRRNNLNKANDIFGNLVFEDYSGIKSILTEKVEQEISQLTRIVKAKPSPKLIESVINPDVVYESKISRNIKNTIKDIGKI